MALFSRNENEDEEYEDEEELDLEEERQDRKFTRKFKDLKSQNKKKRKEPPKPWGKKERFMVLAIMAATIIIASALAIIARGANFSGFSKLALPKIDFPSLNFFKEETIIIQKK